MEEEIITTLKVFGKEAYIVSDGEMVWAYHKDSSGKHFEKPAVANSPESLYQLICEVSRDFMAEHYREVLAK